MPFFSHDDDGKLIFYDVEVFPNLCVLCKGELKPMIDKKFAIKNVIFNPPATIVFWEDGTKTVVKCKNEKFDPEKGLAMAFSKKMLGNKGNYYEVFKKWLPKEEKNESTDIIKDISSKISKPKPQTFTFDLKPIDINKKLFEVLTGAPSGTTIQFEDAKEEPKRNPVEEAYKKLVDHRDNNGEISFDELIGLLGEALDD